MINYRRLLAVFLIGILGLASVVLADEAPLSALRADVMAVWNDPAPSDGLPEIPELPELAQLPDGRVLRADALVAETPPEPRVNTYPFFQKGTATSSTGAGSLFAVAPPTLAPMTDVAAENDAAFAQEDAQ
ncbi:hypothetical protein [Thioclava sp. GXIMD4216]|uniref:hypothetical protein n=1 Tax=Thioclava sp. GXIMD4216 TaxID=3131929 RepID=UPI0030CB9140